MFEADTRCPCQQKDLQGCWYRRRRTWIAGGWGDVSEQFWESWLCACV